MARMPAMECESVRCIERSDTNPCGPFGLQQRLVVVANRPPLTPATQRPIPSPNPTTATTQPTPSSVPPRYLPIFLSRLPLLMSLPVSRVSSTLSPLTLSLSHTATTHVRGDAVDLE